MGLRLSGLGVKGFGFGFWVYWPLAFRLTLTLNPKPHWKGFNGAFLVKYVGLGSLGISVVEFGGFLASGYRAVDFGG